MLIPPYCLYNKNSSFPHEWVSLKCHFKENSFRILQAHSGAWSERKGAHYPGLGTQGQESHLCWALISERIT